MLKTISCALTEITKKESKADMKNGKKENKDKKNYKKVHIDQNKDNKGTSILLSHLIQIIKSSNDKKNDIVDLLIYEAKDTSIFLEKIRLEISNQISICNNNDERIRLSFYHSVVHLLQLVLKKNYPIYRIVREWVMVNFDHGDNELVKAMRGFFKGFSEDENLKVIESGLHKIYAKNGFKGDLKSVLRKENLNHFYYNTYFNDANYKSDDANYKNPFLNEFKKTCIKILNKCITKTKNIFENIFSNIFEYIFDKQLPINIDRNYDLTNYVDSSIDFPDILCYKSLYGPHLIKTKNELGYLLEKMNIPKSKQLYANILLGRFYDALTTSPDLINDPILRLIFLLCIKFKHKSEHSKLLKDCFERIGIYLLEIDWQLALDYFLYSGKINYYFNLVMRKIALDNLSFTSLYNFAKKYFLENKLVEFYAQTLLSKGDFYALHKHVIKYDVMLVNARFVEFCYDKICKCMDSRLIIDQDNFKTDYKFDEHKFYFNKFDEHKFDNDLDEQDNEEYENNNAENDKFIDKKAIKPIDKKFKMHICGKAPKSDFIKFLQIVHKIRTNLNLTPHEMNFFFSISKYDIFVYHKELLIYLKDKNLSKDEALVAFTLSVKYKMSDLNSIFNEKIRNSMN
ncbi:hypothetical protein DMUE_3187 [Dictyocoela muelleri]|nr:hypothetical protein DMUE_3187 [Dictyocoela muelleri]